MDISEIMESSSSDEEDGAAAETDEEEIKREEKNEEVLVSLGNFSYSTDNRITWMSKGILLHKVLLLTSELCVLPLLLVKNKE